MLFVAALRRNCARSFARGAFSSGLARPASKVCRRQSESAWKQLSVWLVSPPPGVLRSAESTSSPCADVGGGHVNADVPSDVLQRMFAICDRVDDAAWCPPYAFNAEAYAVAIGKKPVTIRLWFKRFGFPKRGAGKEQFVDVRDFFQSLPELIDGEQKD